MNNNLKKRLFIGAAFALLLSGSQLTKALGANEIMAKNDALIEEQSSIQENVLAIFRGGKREVKQFETRYRRFGDEVRVVMQFSYPTRLGFLVWNTPGIDSQQWMKMSSGRVRKISTADRGNSWVNSDFYNEDLSEFYLDDFNYKLLDDATVDGVDCYVVEAIKKQDAVYSSRNLYLGKQDFVIRKVVFFEHKKPSKILQLESIEQIDGIYTARKATMSRLDEDSKSVLYLKTVKHNAPVSKLEVSRESF